MPLTDRTLDLLVLTHPDQDHIFAFPEILRRYQVSSVLLTGIDKESSKYKEILRLLKEQHIPLLIADPKKDIDLGDGAVLDVLWPRPVWVGKLTTKANDSGIVLRLLYGTRSVVFPADVEKPSEVAILSSGEELRGDILKAAHHGSRTSSSTGFLLAVDPSLGIFSAPIISPYGHPHPDVVARYKAFGIETRQTGREGTISVTLDRN
jgi:competence protein ComEC